MFDATAPKGIHAYWKTENFNNLSDDAISVLVEHTAKMKSLSHFAAVHIHHWGGTIERVNKDATAFAHRDARYVMNIIGLWMEHENADKHIDWTRNFSRAMQPFSTGKAYLNFLGDEGVARVKAAYDAKRYDRLVALKNKYDPANLFRLNQNIKPKV
ncbi:MAG TPA: BBE domain-containing protein [Draconibacterium sp.]|nr:BBE domain-containing protein [Draconibacterium sp.]